MGVRVDRILSYTVDVSNIELCDLDDRVNGIKIYDRDFSLNDEHLAIVYDGMSGEYTKLCYIVYCEHDCDDYSDSDFYKVVTSMLSMRSEVPSYIVSELNLALKAIGIENDMEGVKLEVFRHFY